jgi:hypothetical protein
MALLQTLGFILVFGSFRSVCFSASPRFLLVFRLPVFANILSTRSNFPALCLALLLALPGILSAKGLASSFAFSSFGG